MLAVVWLGLACLLGCSGSSSLEPVQPAILQGPSSLGSYTVDQLNKDYQAYLDEMAKPNRGGAREIRDRIVNRTRTEVFSTYSDFEAHFEKRVADMETLADFGELGVATATTITGGESVKTILAASLTALKGARLSLEKNYLKQKTTDLLIARMRAARVEQETVILGKLTTLDVDKYPMEEAWTDLVVLYYAGTLPNAFQKLNAEAGAAEKNATDKQQAVNEARAPILKSTREKVDATRELMQRILALSESQASTVLESLHIARPADKSARLTLRDEAEKALAAAMPGDDVWKKWEGAVPK
jgi:hypothetical protein